MLDAFSEVDELPTDVDAALEADDVLSARAGVANSAHAVARLVAAHKTGKRAVMLSKGVEAAKPVVPSSPPPSMGHNSQHSGKWQGLSGGTFWWRGAVRDTLSVG